jgi:hypothetical protein
MKMIVMSMIIYCEEKEFKQINNIMERNGYGTDSIIKYAYPLSLSYPNTIKAEYSKREDKLKEFENIFDF